MKKITILAIAFVIVSACDSGNKIESQNGEIGSSIAAGGESEEELKKSLAEVQKEEEELAKVEAATITTMSFDKMVHDFGNIKVDTDNNATFVVTNTGKNPLIIEDVSVSCGCTTAEKPEKPIAPGKSDKISVIFHPKPGQLKEQKKSIAITANTNPKVVSLDIKAFVKE
jgi:hypothetical protein